MRKMGRNRRPWSIEKAITRKTVLKKICTIYASTNVSTRIPRIVDEAL